MSIPHISKPTRAQCWQEEQNAKRTDAEESAGTGEEEDLAGKTGNNKEKETSANAR